jgi:hypothetical protein
MVEDSKEDCVTNPQMVEEMEARTGIVVAKLEDCNCQCRPWLDTLELAGLVPVKQKERDDGSRVRAVGNTRIHSQFLDSAGVILKAPPSC